MNIEAELAQLGLEAGARWQRKLDRATPDTLNSFAFLARRHPGCVAHALGLSGEGSWVCTRLLAAWADNKAAQKRCMSEGDPLGRRIYASICKEIELEISSRASAQRCWSRLLK